MFDLRSGSVLSKKDGTDPDPLVGAVEFLGDIIHPLALIIIDEMWGQRE